jgi:hypothetical protein
LDVAPEPRKGTLELVALLVSRALIGSSGLVSQALAIARFSARDSRDLDHRYAYDI